MKKVKEALEFLLRAAIDNEAPTGAEEMAREALAALPDKPLTEAEVLRILELESSHFSKYGKDNLGIRAIKALKAANVLYVAEEQ